MRRLFLGTVLFCLLSGLGAELSCAGEEADISAKAEVDHAFITIGSEILFRLSITHRPDLTVLDTNAYKALDDFEIKSEKDFSYREGTHIVEGKTYTLTNYELGEYVIRPIDIRYRTKAGELSKLETAKLFITVESVDKTKDPASDIRGVKGVVDLRTSLMPWMLLALLAAGGGVGIWFWQMFRKKAGIAERKPEEILSPQDEAYRALNELSHSNLLQRGELKTYFLRMSEILRRYFERRYHIHALELTTNEVMAALKDKMGSAELNLIKETLLFCDLVKFAKFAPAPPEILRQNQEAKKIVDQTKEVTPETIIAPTGSEQ